MAKGGWRANAGRPTKRYKVTDCRSIDVRSFQQVGALRSHWQGSWYWWSCDTGEVTYQIQVWVWGDDFWIRFPWKGQHIEETIRLERTACHLGGTRPWFLCPGCQRRAAILYLHKGAFRCRHCHDLRYQCQSEDAIDRTWRAQAKVERKIGRSQSRPKGMHKTTHERLAEKVTTVERERRAIMITGLRRVMGMD